MSKLEKWNGLASLDTAVAAYIYEALVANISEVP